MRTRTLAALLTALIFLLFATPVFALDLIETESGEASDLIATEEEIGKDPGTYTTAENGYAYTAPRVDDASLRVYDFAGLLSENEEADLTNYLVRAENQKNATVLAVTTENVALDPDYGVDRTRAYAEDFYDANADSFNDDAFVLCIDMNNRVIYTVGHGRFATEKYVKFEEKVYNDVYDKARNGDYHGVVKVFAEDVYKLENWRYAMIPTFGSLIASVFGGLIVMLVSIGRHKKAAPSKANIPEVELLSGKQTVHESKFLGKHLSTRIRPRSSDNDSGGGGGGGFSGGMHTSGGGGSFSGGGGHF